MRLLLGVLVAVLRPCTPEFGITFEGLTSVIALFLVLNGIFGRYYLWHAGSPSCGCNKLPRIVSWRERRLAHGTPAAPRELLRGTAIKHDPYNATSCPHHYRHHPRRALPPETATCPAGAVPVDRPAAAAGIIPDSEAWERWRPAADSRERGRPLLLELLLATYLATDHPSGINRPITPLSPAKIVRSWKAMSPTRRR